jgi:hypothetical protein
VDHEPLIVLMPSDHRLTSREAIHPREFVGEIFIGGSKLDQSAAFGLWACGSVAPGSSRGL